MGRKPCHPWTLERIRLIRAEIKAELTTVEAEGGQRERLRANLKIIKEMDEKQTSEELLRRYTLILFALLHHERHGGLSASQIRQLTDLARTILGVADIKNDPTVKLAFLFGDLHLVSSQIHRRDGMHWQSAWEQLEARHYSRRDPINGKGQQLLGTAIRSIRLGNAEIAIRNYLEAEQFALEPRQIEIARLGRIKALRLANRVDDAIALCEATRSMDLTPKALTEIQWEQTCCLCVTSRGLAPMIELIGSSKPFQRADFIAEAYMWSLCYSTLRWKDHFENSHLARSMRRLARSTAKTHLTKIAMEVSLLYDATIPFATRITNANSIVKKRASLVSIDKEILVLGAIQRWFIRNRQFPFAQFVGQEFRTLCRRLSEFERDDVFGFAEH